MFLLMNQASGFMQLSTACDFLTGHLYSDLANNRIDFDTYMQETNVFIVDDICII